MAKSIDTDNKEFGAILASDKTTMVAFVNPASGYDVEDIIEALQAKGINAEMRTPNTETKEVTL